MTVYRKRRRRRKADPLRVLLFVIILLLAAAVIIGVILFLSTRKGCRGEEVPDIVTTEAGQSSAAVNPENQDPQNGQQGSENAPAESNGEAGSEASSQASQAPSEGQTQGNIDISNLSGDIQAIYKQAERMAMQYDYNGAVAFIQNAVPDYANYQELNNFVYDCQAKDTQLVKWKDNTQITHVFFHTLIYDTETAFNSYERDDYNMVMTTIDEFNEIIQEMYDRGYVMVRLSDISEIDPATGQMAWKEIRLPEGKKPFVLSEDDVSYYEYMNETGGYANRLVVTADGKIMNEVDNPDGTVTQGAFDMVPLIDQFVEEHPDFSYHGAKGYVALTGYNGILGYRTSYITYGSQEARQAVWNDLFVGNFDSAHAVELADGAHLYDNPNIEADRAMAKTVADAMKAEGWEFASHTWGHMDMSTVVDQATGQVISERFYRDTQWWATEVEPLIGETDTIIFAKGADIGSWRGYEDNNEAYLYLKSKGFNYYCNVDSSQYYVQMSSSKGGSGYLRQGRRNLDGLLMFKALVNYTDGSNPTLELTDIIDVWKVFDFDARPLPVNGVKLPEGFAGLTSPDGTFYPVSAGQ